MRKKGRNVLMGIGNILRGDDGIGIYIVNNFNDENWISLNCGTVPENFTSIVKKEKPDYLVIVDAAELSLKPGEFRKIPKEKISEIVSTFMGTHNIPISHLVKYLGKYVKKEIIFIGIQPKSLHLKETISKELKSAAKKIIEILKKEKFNEIREYE